MSGPEHVNPRSLTTYLMPNGDVALESAELSPQENIAAFGDKGACPPQSLEALTDQCMNMIAAVPDEADTMALTFMKKGLENSLAKVTTMLVKLAD